MRWRERRAQRQCASQPLVELIRDELDETQCARLAAHLDTCETCQQRLTNLTAESQWWLDAGRLLDPAELGAAELGADDMGAVDMSAADMGVASGNDDPTGEFFDDCDHLFGDRAKELLAIGLLIPSDDAGCIGTLGRYQVQSVLGSGGTGVVLKAIDIELNRTVAIKVLSPTLAASGAARRRFAREGKAVAAVAHENVIAVHQVEGNGRLPYLVMQYIDGDSLQELVSRVGPMDVTTALRVTAQIASALSAAHDQGLVHRDVKPANILVGAAGQRVWITDFGLARAVDDASLTRTGFIAGTPHYMSPEQARGEVVRASSDLFGLGSVLYFMLTGRPPFRAERTLAILSRICHEPHRPVREVNPDVPPPIAELVDQLLRKSAADRIADADAVRTRCLHLLAAMSDPDVDLNEWGTNSVARQESPRAAESIQLGPQVGLHNGVHRGMHGASPTEAHSSNPNRRRGRFGLWALVLFLLLLGLGFSSVVGAYVINSIPTPVDQDMAEEPAAAPAFVGDSELMAQAKSGDMKAYSMQLDAQRQNQDSASAQFGNATAAESEWESPPNDSVRPAPSLNPMLASPLGNADAAPTSVNDEVGAEPMRFVEQPPSTAFFETANANLVNENAEGTSVAYDDRSAWAMSLAELRAAVTMFQQQIAQPLPSESVLEGTIVNGVVGSGVVADSLMTVETEDAFERELHRMEETLRQLEMPPSVSQPSSDQDPTRP